MNAPAPTDPDLAQVNAYAQGMADAFEQKALVAELLPGATITISAQAALDAATVIKAFIKIITAMEASETALRDRAERAEAHLALTNELVGQIDKLSLLGLLFFRLQRGKE